MEPAMEAGETEMDNEGAILLDGGCPAPSDCRVGNDFI
jgi:hypothetical protein